MKLPKLNKATDTCVYRPVMSHVYVTKENTVVFNASVLVAHKTSNLFNRSFISLIPKDGMYITSNDWKVFTTEFTHVRIDENLLITVERKGGERLIRAKKYDNVGVYPNWKDLFKNPRKRFKCGDFGIRASNVTALQAATGSDNLRFQCFDNSKQINVIVGACDYEDVQALIMPVMF